VRAAVTVALDASLERMVDEITRRVLAAMRSGNAEPRLYEQRTGESRVPHPRIAESGPSEPVLAPPQAAAPKPAAPLPAATQVEPVRRVTPLRIRSGSILGLDISRPEPPAQDPE
jgi:hypothetical protein